SPPSLTSAQFSPTMSSTQTAPEVGPESPKAPQQMHREPYPMSGETSPKILKRKSKSGNLHFEKVWGEFLDEKVSQELQKVSMLSLRCQSSTSLSPSEYTASLRGPLNSHIVREVQAEYTEGEQLPSEDAIAYTQFGRSMPELKKALRAKERTKIKQRLASRENYEKQMEAVESVSKAEGTRLRSG
ncbi:MAG: hypothetical protein Q9204_008302, partial [Flavoplaca sp. TL-2023a]